MYSYRQCLWWTDLVMWNSKFAVPHAASVPTSVTQEFLELDNGYGKVEDR